MKPFPIAAGAAAGAGRSRPAAAVAGRGLREAAARRSGALATGRAQAPAEQREPRPARSAEVTVAVAGAIALQMLFAAMNADFNRATGQDPTRAQFAAYSEDVTGEAATSAIEKFRATKGVEVVIGSVQAYASKPGVYTDDDIPPTTSMTVGTCDTLRELADHLLRGRRHLRRPPAGRQGHVRLGRPHGPQGARWSRSAPGTASRCGGRCPPAPRRCRAARIRWVTFTTGSWPPPARSTRVRCPARRSPPRSGWTGACRTSRSTYGTRLPASIPGCASSRWTRWSATVSTTASRPGSRSGRVWCCC